MLWCVYEPAMQAVEAEADLASGNIAFHWICHTHAHRYLHQHRRKPT